MIKSFIKIEIAKLIGNLKKLILSWVIIVNKYNKGLNLL